MSLAPILPYITWGIIWDPQSNRGIPNFIENTINIICNISNNEEEDISIAKYINTKLRRVKKIRRLYNYKRGLIEMV